MAGLKIFLLGIPEIKLDGAAVTTDRRKAVALLAYLAVSGRPHARDALAALFWPDYARKSAHAYLRRALWELNQMLGKGWLETDKEKVQLAADTDIWLDTAQFESLLDTGAGAQVSGRFEAAVRLYRGDFMAGFSLSDTAPFDNWQTRQVEYFRRLLAGALEGLADALAAAGEYESALPHARRWLSLDPLNEVAHRTLMHLLAGMGDRTGAIRQYEKCVRILKDELGISPQPETEQLYQAVLHREIPAAGRPAADVVSAVKRTAPSLPAFSTPFIGRRREVEQLISLLLDHDHRFVTLVGPGGTGKTRLAIQAASELIGPFPDGVFFTQLGSLQSQDGIVQAVANSVGFSFYRDEKSRRRQLLDFLREKRLLLILDNFEHLLESSGLVTDILAHAPAVTVLVTSRVRLNLQGEQLCRVDGMQLPGKAEAAAWEEPEEQAQGFSALQLFVDRARLVRPGFALNRENIRPVLEICRLVQGMPLGLELAASWLELLPPEEIAGEIARSLDFLHTNQADVPDRQSSIRAVFESSWKLLSEMEKDAFLRLCVFSGDFSHAAARKVSGADLRALLGLANKSFLQQKEGGRFQLHELMRQYGEERLRMDPAAWRAAKNSHAEYYAGFVADQVPRICSPEQPAALQALEEELEPEIKTAWDWFVTEKRWDRLLEHMLPGLFRFSLARLKSAELISWFRAARLALMSPSSEQERLAFAVFSTVEIYSEEFSMVMDANPMERLSALWVMVREYDLAEGMGFWFVLLAGMVYGRNIDSSLHDPRLEEVVARLRMQDDPWELGMSLLIHSNWWSQYDFDEGKLLEALHIFQHLGVVYEQRVILELLGRHAFQQRRSHAEIMGYFDRARGFKTQFDGQPGSAFTWMFLVGIYFQLGEIEQGFGLLHEQQEMYERMGNLRSLQLNLAWEALHALRYSSYEHALVARKRALELAQKEDKQSDLSWSQFELGETHRVFGQLEKGMTFYEQAQRNFEEMRYPLGLAYCERARGDIDLEEGRCAEALEHYRLFLQYSARENHLWSIAQAHAKLALAHARLGSLDESRLEMRKALVGMYAGGEYDLNLLTLLAEPVCLMREGKPEEAAELASFIASHPVSWNETRAQANAILEEAARTLPEGAFKRAVAQGKLLDLDAVVAGVAEGNKSPQPSR